MELTPEKIDQFLDALLSVAKKEREKIPHSRTEDFSSILVFLGPNMETATTPITWRNEQDKYAKMRGVSATAKELLCQAVILITDTRWVENERAEKFLGLPPLSEVGVEKWSKLYSHELKTRYGGYLGNAPPELYSEAIMAVMKGPRIEGIPTRMAKYEKGPNDTIHWIETDKMDSKTAHFNLLPDWWC